jgi:transmembrane protein TMEM260 (protein O-mannosyltransferase)
MKGDKVLTLSLFLAFLALYVRTAAPSVLAGDSAEFQIAAPLLGVPHPTTYPLYTLLGKLATLIIPLGDMAYRVTLVSSVAAAGTVALFFLLARRVTCSAPAAMLAALALGVAPGLWNAATLAEVYALLAALLAALGALLASTPGEREPRTENREPTNDQRPTTNDREEPPREYPTTQRVPDREPTADIRRVNREPTDNLQSAICNLQSIQRTTDHGPRTAERRLRLAAFVAGLGFTHHGLFALIGLPVFAGYCAWWFVRRIRSEKQPISFRGLLISMAILALCFALGMTPWLYPLVQYARYGPFADARDYGLPRHYFWGAPTSWGDVFGLLLGGQIGRSIFRVPTAGQAGAVIWMVGKRLWFEFGPVGWVLGPLGFVALPRRCRGAWLGAAWVFGATLLYLMLLGPAVEDAPVFTLPMLLPWALWIAAAVEFILRRVSCQLSVVSCRRPTTNDQRPTGNREPPRGYPPAGSTKNHLEPARLRGQPRINGVSTIYNLQSAICNLQLIVVILLVAATLAWGYTRVPYASKRRLWLFREFGQTTLQQLPPQAVVIAHWEQGMTLQYLRLVEGQRPDVWVDVVEPSDQAWGTRAQRYAGRPVFFVGAAADVAGMPVELLRAAEYADLFRLRE